MRPSLLAIVLPLALGLLSGCMTGIDHAAENSWQPARDGSLPPGAPPETTPGRAGACAVPCANPCSPCRQVSTRGEVYAGLAVVGGPGLGGSVSLGQVFARTRLATWSFEMEATYEDQDVSIFGDGEGEFGQVRGGAKASFLPLRRWHPTLRGGFGWFRANGDNEFVDEGDYIAFHLGAGLELDVNGWLTTGPEVTGLLAAEEKDFDLEVVPQARWHFVVKF